MKGLIVVGAVTAGEDSHLRIHGFAIGLSLFDFFGDFFVVFVMEGAFDNDSEANNNKSDGEDGFPGNVIGKNILSGEQEDDAGGEKAEAR